jgi:hypothetical protein
MKGEELYHRYIAQAKEMARAELEDAYARLQVARHRVIRVPQSWVDEVLENFEDC